MRVPWMSFSRTTVLPRRARTTTPASIDHRSPRSCRVPSEEREDPEKSIRRIREASGEESGAGQADPSEAGRVDPNSSLPSGRAGTSSELESAAMKSTTKIKLIPSPPLRGFPSHGARPNEDAQQESNPLI